MIVSQIVLCTVAETVPYKEVTSFSGAVASESCLGGRTLHMGLSNILGIVCKNTEDLVYVEATNKLSDSLIE